MTFTTPQFVVLFLAFFGAWWLLRGTARKLWLLAGSYFFYASWDARFLGLLMLSTFVDYWVGLALGETEDLVRRKRLVALSLTVNLGILGFFKYFNFFYDSAQALLASLGLDVPPRVLHVVLPVGISFYTFQTLSYTIDVYRRDLQPTRSLLDFATFVAAFPQLVAGPIERASHLLPQIARIGTSAAARVDHTGWFLIALGAFKKAVIADNIGAYAEHAYVNVDQTFPIAAWLGTYAFAIQIYCDFSGYSDIAIGLGRLLGLDIMQNFRAPYAARGPSEFWTRWHISLSSWLRDYLYIPLGGNRGTHATTMRNLMVTMLLGGLWHGAAWNFVLWGFFHGALLVVGRLPLMASIGGRLDVWPGLGGKLLRTLQALLFFHLVCVGWSFFRAQSLHDCLVLVQKLFAFGAYDVDAWLPHVKRSGEAAYLMIAGLLGGGVVLSHLLWPIGSSELAERVRRWPVPVTFAACVLMLYAAAILSPEQSPPFIYFQF